MVKRANPVEEKVAVVLNKVHKTAILGRDNAVVAAHVKEIVKHAGIGQKDFVAAPVWGIEAVEPKQRVFGLAGFQPFDHFRLEAEQGPVNRGIEAGPGQEQVKGDDSDN